MPEITTAEVDTIPGEQKMSMFFFFPSTDSTFSTEVSPKRLQTRLLKYKYSNAL